jgi:hypothetical protein
MKKSCFYVQLKLKYLIPLPKTEECTCVHHYIWFHVYVENGVLPFSLVEVRTKISKILLWLNNLSNPGIWTSYASLGATLDN